MVCELSYYFSKEEWKNDRSPCCNFINQPSNSNSTNDTGREGSTDPARSKDALFYRHYRAKRVCKKAKKVQIKGQLHIGEIPIGHPFVVSEEITETIDLEKLKMLIDVYAGPLLKIGIGVVKRRIGL